MLGSRYSSPGLAIDGWGVSGCVRLRSAWGTKEWDREGNHKTIGKPQMQNVKHMRVSQHFTRESARASDYTCERAMGYVTITGNMRLQHRMKRPTTLHSTLR